MMELITTRTRIRGVADKFRKQYHSIGWKAKDKQRRLDALDIETATAKDVATIIGNATWTWVRCNECGTNVESVVRIGEAQDHESQTAFVCKKCIMKALALFNTEDK